MTAAFFRGKRRRAAAAVGAVSFGLIVLSACDKPTPMATVTVGTSTVTSEAACFEDGDGMKPAEVAKCLEGDSKTIKADMDDKIRFGVEPEIADKGWSLFVNGRPVPEEPNTKTYRTIPASAFFSGGQGALTADKTKISIVEVSSGKALGVWNFDVERKS
ncbi:DUF2771 domain-containing protein [Streptomyces stramineus]